MDAEFIDKESMTSDQKFAFMLLERIEALEKETTELRNAFKNLFTISPVPECAKPLYDKLMSLYDDRKQKEIDEYKMSNDVPAHILQKVPKNFHIDIDSIMTYKLSQTFSIYNASLLLKKYKDVDPEFVEWFATTLGV